MRLGFGLWLLVRGVRARLFEGGGFLVSLMG